MAKAVFRGCSGGCVYAAEAEAVFDGSGLTPGRFGWLWLFLSSTMRAWFRREASTYLRVATGPGPSSIAPSTADALCPSRLWRFYQLDAAQLIPSLIPALRPLHADDETKEWLRSCKPNICTSLLASVLRLFYSVTDTNAILRRGQMFVLSDAQIRLLLARPDAETLLAEAEAESSASGRTIEAAGGDSARSSIRSPAAPAGAGASLGLGRLLDIGAGDGNVTAVLARHFREVTATEVSVPMCARLRERGFRVFNAPFLREDAGFPAAQCAGTFDVVSMLNLLDRCDQPAEMLAAARRLLAPGGRLLIAVVLPFGEFVEEGTVRRRPHGALPMRGARCSDGASFEASLNALVQRALAPAGFRVRSVSKVPYLCRGDMRRPYYVLSDAIVVCDVDPAFSASAGAGAGAGLATVASAGAGAAFAGASLAAGASAAASASAGAAEGGAVLSSSMAPGQTAMSPILGSGTAAASSSGSSGISIVGGAGARSHGAAGRAGAFDFAAADMAAAASRPWSVDALLKGSSGGKDE